MKKYWRLFNSTLLLIAFIAPWFRSCGSNTINGFDAISISGDGALKAPFSLYPIIFVGLACLLLYILLNLFSLSVLKAEKLRPWRKRTLIGGVAGMIFVPILPILEESLWGYWLTWIGLLSSIVLEARENQNSKANTPDN